MSSPFYLNKTLLVFPSNVTADIKGHSCPVTSLGSHDPGVASFRNGLRVAPAARPGHGLSFLRRKNRIFLTRCFPAKDICGTRQLQSGWLPERRINAKASALQAGYTLLQFTAI